LLANPDAIVLPAEQITAGHVFVAERTNAIVGFAAILPRDNDAVELDGVFVELRAWRTGVASRLLQRCIAYANDQKVESIQLVANSGATGFYLACGFGMIGTCETRFGPAIRMQLRIDRSPQTGR